MEVRRVTNQTTNRANSLAAFGRIAVGSGAVALALVVLSRIILPAATAQGALAGILAAYMGSLCGNLPPAIGLGRAPQMLIAAALGGLSLRFVVTIALALILAGFFPEVRTPLLLWTAIAQLALLAVDTVWLLRTVKSTAGANGSVQ